MGRRRYGFDEKRVQKFINEGRGQGTGPDYLPWLRIQDLPSLGRSHRPFGIKTRRVHHFLSDGEWECSLKFEADPTVIDIREQFPLDRLQTLRAAMSLGYRHPVTLDGTPYVMTIDFLVTRKIPSGTQLEPYTFKYHPETLKPREQELIAIAGAFWQAHGLHLRMIDQTFFDEALVLNYDIVRSYFDINNLEFQRTTNVPVIADAIRRKVFKRGEESLGEACADVAEHFSTTSTIVFAIAMHLIARGGFRTDLSNPDGLRGELTSAQADALATGFCIDVENARPYSGDAKGVAERVFNTIQTKFGPYMPGYVDKEFSGRDAEPAALRSAMDIHEISRVMILATLHTNLRVVRDYEGWPEVIASGVPFVPVELWRWGVENLRCDSRRYDETYLKMYLWPTDTMRLTRKALHFFRGLYYMCDDLASKPWFAQAFARRQSFPVI